MAISIYSTYIPICIYFHVLYLKSTWVCEKYLKMNNEQFGTYCAVGYKKETKIFLFFTNFISSYYIHHILLDFKFEMQSIAG